MTFSVDEIKAVFSNLHVSKKKDDYTCGLAPHKPILLLTLLILTKNDRVDLSDITIDMDLRETWSELWGCLKYPHSGPIYLPYYHMRSDGFWHIEFKEDAFEGPLRSLKDITERVYRVRMDPCVIDMFHDPTLWSELVNTLLNAGYFSKEEILCLTDRLKDIDASFEYQEHLQGLVNETFKETFDIGSLGLPPVRAPAFRRMVLKAYDETCAVCGMRLDNSLGVSVVDAAHILPFSQFHNDDVRNGISLCKLHHWLFDHGIISIDTEYKILVSEKIDHEAPERIISIFRNKRIQLPSDIRYHPSPIALAWHNTKVFY